MDTAKSARPRVLVVEDDPVSAAFLEAAVDAFPADCALAGSVEGGRAACQATPPDLLLVDANLPDGRGDDLLASVRALGLMAPALAHTADDDPAVAARLRLAGFADVLHKPLTASAVQAAMARHLPAFQPADWDDASALAALGGVQAHVDALRGIFLKELPAQWQRIAQAAADGRAEDARGDLHRLAASCGFVGALALGQRVAEARGQPLTGELVASVGAAIDALLQGAPGAAPATNPVK